MFKPVLGVFLAAEYLIGRLKGAQPPFRAAAGGQQGTREHEKAGAQSAQRKEDGEEEDAPALKKGKVLKASFGEAGMAA